MEILTKIIHRLDESVVVKDHAFQQIESTLSDLNVLIQNTEKEISKIQKDIEKAYSEKDYANTQVLKQSEIEQYEKLVSFYEKKKELIKKIAGNLRNTKQNIENKGNKIFMNQDINSIDFQNMEVGEKYKIVGEKFIVVFTKKDDNYAEVKASNIKNKFKGGDMLKFEKASIGDDLNIEILRYVNGDLKQLGILPIKNIIKMYKNVS